MSTTSSIAALQPDGRVKSIYCHWDGHPDNVGKTLKEFYNTDEKVNELISLGSLSRLAKYPNPLEEAIGDNSFKYGLNSPERKVKKNEHSYDNPQVDVTIAYHRDRVEDLQINNYFDLENYNLDGDFQNYNYLWMNNKWYIRYKKKWIEFTDEIVEHGFSKMLD